MIKYLAKLLKVKPNFCGNSYDHRFKVMAFFWGNMLKKPLNLENLKHLSWKAKIIDRKMDLYM